MADEQSDSGTTSDGYDLMERKYLTDRPAQSAAPAEAVGINPGGQVMAVPIPAENIPDEKYHNRLLSKEDIQEFWPDAKTLREHDADAAGAGVEAIDEQ